MLLIGKQATPCQKEGPVKWIAHDQISGFLLDQEHRRNQYVPGFSEFCHRTPLRVLVQISLLILREFKRIN